MSFKEPRDLRNRRCFAKRDAESIPKTRLSAMGQLESQRARDHYGAESSAAKKRPLSAALRPAVVVGRRAVKEHG